MEIDGIRKFMHLDILCDKIIEIMKKIFCLVIVSLFFVNIFAQVTKSIPKKVETKTGGRRECGHSHGADNFPINNYGAIFPTSIFFKVSLKTIHREVYEGCW